MTIASSVVDEVTAHATECQPLECCGLLLGTSDHIAGGSIAKYRRVPRDFCSTTARTSRLDERPGIGDADHRFHHSHPHSQPYPSATDLAEAAYPQQRSPYCGICRRKG
jgi:proteasome lid subunit RPN8/RPN11